MTLLNHVGVFLLIFIFWFCIYLKDYLFNNHLVGEIKNSWYFPLMPTSIFFIIFELSYWIIEIFLI